MDSVYRLFTDYTGESVLNISELPASGSNRRYFRVEGEKTTLIAAVGKSIEENQAFWNINKHFASKGINVPAVFAHSQDFSVYLQEDLGDDTLFGRVSHGRDNGGNYSPEEKQLIIRTIRELPKIQFLGAQDFDFSQCFPQPAFDAQTIQFDQNYFKYCFLKATGVEFNEVALERDFKSMSAILMQSMSDTFMYRDFQGRNVMIKDGKLWFVDFQGGRKGPIYYDVASFIWQAKAAYPEDFKQELIDNYLDALQTYLSISSDAFREALRHYVLFRTLQVLGAYGFRGYFEKKPHFLQSIPFAMANLRKLLQHPFNEYPYLSGLLDELTHMKQFDTVSMEKPLEVDIYSFAFDKGIPADNHGNGGGYVFDCRAIDNPGKYEHYQRFSGLDHEVADYFSKVGDLPNYLGDIFDIVDSHVKNYMDRKFTHMMISFGCTDGKLRSVYCAERLAAHISNRFNISVHMVHRELGVEKQI